MSNILSQALTVKAYSAADVENCRAEAVGMDVAAFKAANESMLEAYCSGQHEKVKAAVEALHSNVVRFVPRSPDTPSRFPPRPNARRSFPSTKEDLARWAAWDALEDAREDAVDARHEAECEALQAKLREDDAMEAEADALQAARQLIGSAIPDLETLTEVPGLVGDIVDWTEASAIRPNRILALGTALSVIGTLIGRTVAGPTRSGTHLYLIGLAKTGTGKQHAIDTAKRMLTAAGAASHIGPGEFASGPGIADTLKNQTLSLCLQDEFGSFLKRVNSKRAGGWETQISKVLREAWNISFNRYDSPHALGNRSVACHSPALSIYAMSTIEEFYTSLQSGDLPNGFLNRFIALSSDKRPPRQKLKLELQAVPAGIADSLKLLYDWRGRFAGGLAQANLTMADYEPAPEVHGWASEDAEALYDAFCLDTDDRIYKIPGIETFIGRYGEAAVRLAAIRAAGRGYYDFTVDESDMRWGMDVVRVCGSRLIEQASIHMVEEELSHGPAMNKIVRILKEHGRMTRNDLMRKMQKQVKSRDFDDIMKQLVESGTVKVEQGVAGISATYYTLTVM